MNVRAFGFVLGTALLSATAPQAATVFSAVGPTAADIQSTVDAFRDTLGSLNGNLPVNVAGGRREVNWDGVPDAVSDPAAFPSDFFNGSTPGRARGIEFLPTGSSSAVEVSSSAASGVPIEFGASDDFTTFSPEKLFRTVSGTTLDVLFFDPSSPAVAARTRGLGVVFTGLPGLYDITMSFFGPGDSLLDTSSVALESAAGLAFLGMTFEDAVVTRVAIDTSSSSVVMDDFIYGEPAPVPLPASLPLAIMGVAAFLAFRRRAD